MRGELAIVADEHRCEMMIRWGSNGRLLEPRRCARAKKSEGGGAFCGLHSKLTKHLPTVRSFAGGWCVWCGAPARRYECSRDERMTVSFCVPCAGALAKEIESCRPRGITRQSLW